MPRRKNEKDKRKFSMLAVLPEDAKRIEKKAYKESKYKYEVVTEALDALDRKESH